MIPTVEQMLTCVRVCQTLSRKELRKYVLAHREDAEVLRIYMTRLRTEPGVTRYSGKLNTEDMKKLQKLIKNTIARQ